MSSPNTPLAAPPSPNNPRMTSNQSPEWGLRRRRILLPARNRIGYEIPQQNAQFPMSDSSPPSVSTPPAAESFEAMCEDDASVPKLQLPQLNGWATSSKTALTFAGAGGIATLDRNDVVRVDRASSDEYPWHRAPRVALLAQSNGGLKENGSRDLKSRKSYHERLTAALLDSPRQPVEI